MTKTRKHRLTLEPATNHLIVAIASHEKGYHLAWTLNNKLGMHLVRTGEYTITRKKQEIEQSFPLFRWDDETRMLSFHLVANRSESGILVDKMKNIDFFLHISPKPEEPFLTNLLQQLMALPVIITSFPVAPDENPVLANMIFE
jgi:hypothetical protein